MKPVSLLFAALASFQLCAAEAVLVLDFEAPLPGGMTAVDFWQGTVVPDSGRVTDQYLNLGVRVSGAALVQLGNGHAASGINGLGGMDANNRVDYDIPLSFELFSPMDGITPATTDYFGYSPDQAGSSGNRIVLSAYGLDDSLLGQVAYTESTNFSPNSPLTISGVGQFHRIVIDPTLDEPGSGGIATDLVRFGDFTIAPAAIPEPATLALLGLGLAGLRFSRRKQ